MNHQQQPSKFEAKLRIGPISAATLVAGGTLDCVQIRGGRDSS